MTPMVSVALRPNSASPGGLQRPFLVFLFIAVTAMAAITTAEGVYLRLQRGHSLELGLLAAGRLADWYTCAVLIVPLFWLSRGWPIAQDNWLRAGALHGLAICGAAALKFVIYIPVRGAIDPLASSDIHGALANGFFGKLLFFTAVCGALHAIYYYQQAQPLNAEPSRDPAPVGDNPRIAIRQSGFTRYVDVEQIDWAEAQGNYVVIHAAGGRYCIRTTMRTLQSQLGSDFLRVHRSAIVRRNNIVASRTVAGGRQQLELRDGTMVPLSRSLARGVVRPSV